MLKATILAILIDMRTLKLPKQTHMSATDIQSFVRSIKKLPPQIRTKTVTKLVRTLTPDTLEAKVELAILHGEFNSIFAKALNDYANGKALDRIY